MATKFACYEKDSLTCHASLPRSIRVGQTHQLVTLDASLRSA